jgi:hypothetical protein
MGGSMAWTAVRQRTVQRVIAWTLILLALAMAALAYVVHDLSVLATASMVLSPIALALGVQRLLARTPDREAVVGTEPSRSPPR